MKLIDKTITNSNIPVEIYHSNTLNWTPVIPLVLQTYAELLNNKLATPDVKMLCFGKKHEKTKVIWAQLEDGTPLGGIYYILKDGFGHIILSFTAPEYRGQGINTLCHRYFEEDCKKEGCIRISSVVHMKNQSRLKSAEKSDMAPLFYIMYKRL